MTGKKHLEKNDFIIARQEKEIENQKNKLEELTLKLNDIDILAQEVAEKVYERACEVVTDTVRTETTLEDISTIENMRNRLTGKNSSLSSGQKNFSKYILNRLFVMEVIYENFVCRRRNRRAYKPGIVDCRLF